MDVSLEIKAKRPFPNSFDMEDKPHIRRRKVELRSWQNLPDSFSDNDLVAALHGRKDFSCCEKFPLVCGILIKLRSGFFRVYKRSMCKFPRVVEEDWPRQFYDVAKLLTYDSARLEEEWTVDQLWKGAETLVVKSCNLSIRLQRDLSIHPLYPLDPTTGLLQFHAEFLVRVAEYHESLRRPEGTFELPDSPLIQTLLDVPRIRCNACDGVRQLYCGPCGGLRMSNAESILPPRINLPFDVLLILHWAESLVKCTGIHAGVLAAEGSTTYLDWKKPDEDWQHLVESLNAETDVLLFPYPDSTPADIFPWNTPSTSSSSTEAEVSLGPKRKRLLVLEASWQHAKTMAQRIVDHRKSKGLPPITSVILRNVTGEYWRFQTVGQTAVSTIEAIAHTARAAGSPVEDTEAFLTLFRLQKYRVLKKSETRKTPRAVEVSGVGLGSWKEVVNIASSEGESNERLKDIVGDSDHDEDNVDDEEEN